MRNKAQIAAWVKDHGEDSDFVRVRVRGVFPRTGSLQFIDGQRVDQAVARPLTEDPTAALVMIWRAAFTRPASSLKPM